MSKTKLSINQQSVKPENRASKGHLNPDEPVSVPRGAQSKSAPSTNLQSKDIGQHVNENAAKSAGDMGRSFSSRLRELRRDRDLSLRKLGREIGVTANAVLRWEKDEVTPTRGKMLELSRFFDVEPAWLAWGVGSRRARLKPDDLIPQLAQCDETQLTAISALLEAFDNGSQSPA